MKNIAILCDGTWNHPDELENGLPAPTNVVQLAQAIAATDAHGVPQRLYYDPGIGSSGSLFRRLFDGATGTGISENIQQAYGFLADTFELGDKIFLFGFSRGAFTVRSLAGLIRTAGILRRNATARIDDAFALYRSRDPATHPRELAATLFRRTYAVEDATPIQCIGVWDTVGALGNPLILGQVSRRNRFHDTDLSRIVRHAYHAVAINELRLNFTPTLWHKQPDTPGQVLEQRWFCGVHSNVGGGYADHGLSDIALDWLAEKARGAGLSIDALDLNPDPLGKLAESRSGPYLIIPKHYRPIGGEPDTHETLDDSVLRRRAEDPTYRPPNLEDYLRRQASGAPIV